VFKRKPDIENILKSEKNRLAQWKNTRLIIPRLRV
jgi:hypothetical protein